MTLLFSFVLLYRICINHGHFEAFIDQHISGPTTLSVGPSNWNEAVDIIDYASPYQVLYEIARYVNIDFSLIEHIS